MSTISAAIPAIQESLSDETKSTDDKSYKTPELAEGETLNDHVKHNLEVKGIVEETEHMTMILPTMMSLA